MPLIENSSYRPPRILFNAHLQTIYPALFRKVALPPYQRERIHTMDDDFLDLDWLRKGSKRLVILSHGLEGDTSRPYLKGMAKAFYDNSWDCLAWNYRGCSGETNKQLRFYHSGATDDLEFVINHALKKNHYHEILLIGFSLGGNLTLKYLGEQRDKLIPQIKKAIVFSVPLDLYTSCLKLSQPSNYIYSRRFLISLKGKVTTKSVAMPGKFNLDHFSSINRIMDFDDFYTAPIHGYENAKHYYSVCSSISFLDKIAIPTLIINALNDPFLSKECFPYDLLKNHKTVFFESPSEGGHCGFAVFNNNQYWSEMRALEFAGQAG